MQVARTIAALRATVSEWKNRGQKISVIPTMGALHEAHLALVRAANSHAERRIVTIFVNPTQFNDASDLANYPRRESDDAALIENEGVDLLFAPDPGEMYSDGYSTTITVKRVSEGMCGAFRPGHFDGVATVVAKLFNQTQADVAFFGEKDYQQLHVVRRMVRDLDFPITIIGHPTVRETDGLAMSSRNARMTPAERAIAPKLSETLFRAASEIAQGRPVPEAVQAARHALANSGFASPEYLEFRSEKDLCPLDAPSEPARLLAAVFLGKVRLIDNVRVP